MSATQLYTGGEFYTGRDYGQPQIIGWEIVRTYPDPDLWRWSVRFMDTARGIAGYALIVLLKGIEGRGKDDVRDEIEHQLLSDYDNGKYSLEQPT